MMSWRLFVNVLLVLVLGLALYQLYNMGWSLTQGHWPAFKVANVPFYLERVSHHNLPYILYRLILVVGIMKLIQVVNQKLFKNNSDINNTHGSARFATSKEIKKLNYPQGIPIGLMPKSSPTDNAQQWVEGIQRQKGGKVLRVNPDHLLVVAPSGAGKGVGFIIPTILDYPGSLVVTDIKAAENFYVTARYRREQGRKTYVIDTDHVTGQVSSTVNILDILDPNSPQIVEEVGILSSIIRPIPQHDSENVKYFAEQSLAVIQCLMLYVVCHPKFNQEHKNLPFIYDLLCQESEHLTELFRQIREDTEVGYGTPSRLAAAVLSTTERELSGVFNSARQELRFLDSPMIRNLTSNSSMNLKEIIEGQADLYLCVPSEAMATQGRLVRLLLSALFLLLKKQKKKPLHPLLMLLDEMPLLGNIPEVEKALIIGRGYGVRLMCVAQTIELLKATYPHAWKTMLASNLSLFIGASDPETARYISDKLGQKTIEFETTNTGKSKQKGLLVRSNASTSQAESINYTARALLTPDEVAALGDDVVLAFMRGQRPMPLKKIKYFTHLNWKAKADPNPLEATNKK